MGRLERAPAAKPAHSIYGRKIRIGLKPVNHLYLSFCENSKMAVNTRIGSNDEVISKVCKEIFSNIVSKEEQLSTVRSLLEGTDVLADQQALEKVSYSERFRKTNHFFANEKYQF